MDMFLTMAVGGTEGFCHGTANIWQIVGYVLLVFKIVVPLLLIIFGMIDLGKAVIASKEDEIKKATGSLVRRAIAAVVIFLLPTLIGFIVGLIGGFTEEASEDYEICKKCITNPNNGCERASAIWSGESN